MKFGHEKTKEVLKWFEEISKIPRCSKNEDQISKWLQNWAKENHFDWSADEAGNVVIKVPGTNGYESSPIVVLQGHMDMVCEKTKDSNHDFAKDPIKFVYEGEWLTAEKTTLGADNGIAIAMAMVMALDNTIEHPPLELLFTVDEETGLTGANALEPGFIEGKILINIDSEGEGIFTVGCAGGINTNLSLPLTFEPCPTNYSAYTVIAEGMKGGHSGIDIGLGRANALKALGRSLYYLKNVINIRIADFKGGSAHNAIPRDAEAVIIMLESDVRKAKKLLSEFEGILASEFKAIDPDIKIKIEENKAFCIGQAIDNDDTIKLLEFISALPHGVAAMSSDVEGLIETSNNFANAKIENQAFKVLTSQRSSVSTRLQELTNRIESIARISGGEAESGDGYPPWQPNMDSPLLAKSITLYEGLFNKKPMVEVIHAGLECGIIGYKNPGIDMISIGPDLRNSHSPDEKIHIGTIGKVWEFIVALFKELKQ